MRGMHLPSALVLAGGLGTRLQSVYGSGPKALAPVGNKPFLDYLLTWVARSGINNVVLCVGYKAEQIRDYAGAGEAWNLCLQYSVEEKALGTGGAIKKAESLLAGDCMFVMNGDTYIDLDFSQMLAFHRQTGALATMAVARVPDADRYGSLEVDQSGRVLAFCEKAKVKTGTRAGEKLINGGVYLLRRECLDKIPTDCTVSLEREVLPELVSSSRVFAFVTDGYFLDIGTEDDYNRAQTEFTERFSSSHSH